jgi:ABC-type transport system involved in multi-copper enzyme maturation permease subunit
VIRIFKAEWRKLRRPTLLLGTLGAVTFFSGLVSSLLFLLLDSPTGNGDRGVVISRETLSQASGATQAFSSLGALLGIVALCVFAAQTSQEYTYGTLRNILVRQPSRIKVLVGKLAAMKAFALLMVTVSAIVSVGISLALAGGKGVSTELWFNADGQIEIAKTFLNVLISVIGFGIIGMTLGLLLRSPISSISIGVLWLLIVENIVSAVRQSTLSWLPGNQLLAIASGGTPDISYTHALLVGGAYVFAGSLLAVVLFSQRDVAN